MTNDTKQQMTPPNLRMIEMLSEGTEKTKRLYKLYFR